MNQQKDVQQGADRALGLDLHYWRESLLPLMEGKLRDHLVAVEKHEEWLRIERGSGSLFYRCLLDDGAEVRKQYRIGEVAGWLLDSLTEKQLQQIEGSPEDAMIPARESRRYSLTVDYEQAGRRSLSGSYDREELPAAWGDFIERVLEVMDALDQGELLSPSVFTRPKRRSSDQMILSVMFQPYGKEYSYLCEDERVQPGDEVLVPIGSDGRTIPAQVSAVRWMQADETPYPFPEIKRIIRRFEEAEEADVPEDETEQLSSFLERLKAFDGGLSAESLAREIAEAGAMVKEQREARDASETAALWFWRNRVLRVRLRYEAELVRRAWYVMHGDDEEIEPNHRLPYERIEPFMKAQGYRREADRFVKGDS